MREEGGLGGVVDACMLYCVGFYFSSGEKYLKMYNIMIDLNFLLHFHAGFMVMFL